MSRNNIPFSIGIEEEFYVNSSSCLKNKKINNISFEHFDHQIEIKTGIHTSLPNLFSEVIQNRKFICEQFYDSQIIASGTYPGAIIGTQQKQINSRSNFLFEKFGHALAMVNTCGMHVHIGISNPSKSIAILNLARQYVPMLIAISGNSPFYEGIDTKYSSFRNILLSLLPNTGIQPQFSNLEEYKKMTCFIDSINIDSIKNNNNQWWDMRYNNKYSTIEFRMFDSQADANLVSLLASLCLLITLKCSNQTKNTIKNSLHLNENRWRACKYGITARFVQYETNEEIPVIELWRKFLNETSDYFGYYDGLQNQINSFDELLLNANTALLHQRKMINQNHITSILEFQNKQFISSCQKV